MTAPKQGKDPVSSYRPRLVPWALGIVIGIGFGVLMSFMFDLGAVFAVAFIVVGVAIGVGFAIALQAAFDDMARKKR
ncbi:hypothetical protein [Pseudoclavibacter helvolus]|uniref:hypothetical protein n=1 Tax=Pseudoclavibacter helvolus TaxID=255205 RepID=UPI003C740480